MRSAASPQKKSNPLLLGGIAAAALVVYMMVGSGDDGPTKTTTKIKKKTTSKAAGLFTEADEKAKFPAVTFAASDVFAPGVKKPVVATAAVAPPPNANPSNIPSSITGGDGNWYFTGRPEVNGRPQALLENTTTGESVYVNSGQSWKRGRVATIDVSSVTLVGNDGTTVRVPLLEFGAVPGASPAPVAVASAGGANQPLNVPSGLIGATGPGGLGLRPTGAAAAPGTAAPAAAEVAVAAETSNNQGRRGRRRNRSNQDNPGVQNNVP